MTTQEQRNNHAELENRIKELMRSPIHTELIYAGQAADELEKLSIYFQILKDIFAGDSPDTEKLKKLEFLLREFESSFDGWGDLFLSVLNAIPSD